ncbi:hypothetical protein [Halorubrum saccharovorum]|nr:hypothetical protein [Halorubrum saccharovorum]
MSAHSQPSVGINHPTVVPANFDPEAADSAADADNTASAADDGRADR